MLLCTPTCGRTCFGRIARRNDAHIRDGGGDTDVFHRVVGATKGRVSDAAANADDRDRQILVTKIIAHEFKRAIQRKRRDGVSEGAHTALNHARAHADHDLFSDTGIDKAFRKLSSEFSD